MHQKRERALISAVLMSLVVLASGCTTATTGSGADSSLSDLKASGKLVVGSDIPWEPMEFYDESGEVVGLDVDIVEEIANSLGVSLKMVDYDWDDLFDAVKSGEVDVAISGITITSERLEEMLFSTPYLSAGQVIIVRSDDEEIQKPEDLEDKVVGALIESTSLEKAKELSKNVIEYETISEDTDESGISYDLKTGKIDAIIEDYVPAKSRVSKNPGFKILGGLLTEEYYGIATKLGNNALMDEINNVLREMKRTGELKEIENRWLK